MQTRRDQLQAYRYLLRRILAAMLGSEPESLEQPMRRVSTATFAGAMVGALACAGVALYGWLADTNATRWKNEPNALIVEKETNAAYLYLPESQLASGGDQPATPEPPAGLTGERDEKDMVLVQVLNYTSAQLILDGPVKVVRVSKKSLEGIPRGPRVGIPLAPNSVPDKENLVFAPWTVCSTARTVDDQTRLRVDLVIGTANEELDADPIGDRGLLVSAPDGTTHLVWKGKRLEVDADALRSLSLSPSSAVPVSEMWLGTIEAGQPLAAPVVPQRGNPSPFQIEGRTATIGQVFHTPSPDAYFVMLEDGFSRISEVQALLLLGSGTAREGGRVQTEPTEIPISAVNQASSQTATMLVPDLPETPPELVDLGSADGVPVCLSYEDPEEGVTVLTGGRLPAPAETATDTADDPNTGGGTVGLADRVLVPPGKGTIVGLLPGRDLDPQGYFLITEDGVKYPVPDRQTLAKLGYNGVDPLLVPPSMLRLIPQGPALTTEAAHRTAAFEPSRQ
jgi:type VII secretion protein EccB